MEQVSDQVGAGEADSTNEIIATGEISERITQTIITTNTSYSNSSSFNDTRPILSNASATAIHDDGIEFFDASDSLTLTSDSRSLAQLDRAQDDLSNFKRRIDANTEEQREHADLMAGLQRKVEEYRRRVAEIESQVGAPRLEEKLTFHINETGVDETWTPISESKSASNDYEWAHRLEEEHRKVEELRVQLEQSRLQIAQFQSDNQHLRRQFESTIEEKQRLHEMRERHLAQYLSEEQRRMMDLWAELQQVRRQFNDYRDQTERDLDMQRTELTKVMRNVGGVARQLNLSHEAGGIFSLKSESSSESGVVINQDAVLVEALKRFRDQQAVPLSADPELHDELMKKYEEAIDRIIELESRGDGNTGKLNNLEAELKRTKDKFAESQEVLRKLHDLARECGRNPDITKRTRSLSPTAIHVVPSEVLRSVRYAIRTRDNELQQLLRKLKSNDTEITELKNVNVNVSDIRRRIEKQLAESKTEIATQIKTIETVNREMRRLEERLRTTEAQKTLAEGARKQLEEEIRNLKTLLEQSAIDNERKALEDAEERTHAIEEEYKTRINELTRRMESISDTNKRLKTDISNTKQKLRTLESEYGNVMQRIDEKDQLIKKLEDSREELRKDLERENARYDALTNEMDSLQSTYTATTKNTQTIEMTIKEIKQQRDEFSEQKDALNKELADIKHKIEVEIKKREDAQKAAQIDRNEAAKLQTQLNDYEEEMMLIRHNNDQLDTQLKTTHATLTTLQTSLQSTQNEVQKLTELNAKLQREKQDIMSERKQLEGQLDSLREKLRKSEIECEKLTNANKVLSEKEQKLENAYKEETNRARLLEKELEETRMELEELQRKLKQFEQDNRDRLEIMLQTKASPSERSELYESTEITEIRLKELDDKHKFDLERLESERDELSRRVQLLEDELAEKERLIGGHMSDIESIKGEYQVDIDRLKAEIANIQLKCQSDMDDERDQHSHNMELAKMAEDELRTKLANNEKKLDEIMEREQALQDEVQKWEQKYEMADSDLQKLNSQLETLRLHSQSEIQKWKNDTNEAHKENKNLENTIETLKTQLAGSAERTATLNKTIAEQSAKIRELGAQNRRLEDELEDAKASLTSEETDMESMLSRLRSAEDQLGLTQVENSKLRNEIESFTQQIDSFKAKQTSDENEFGRLKKRLAHLTAVTKEQTAELDKRKTERDQLEKSNRERLRQIEQLNESLHSSESKQNRMRQDMQETSDKLIASETQRNTLTNEVKKLQQELQFGKDQMLRKTDEFHTALEHLASAHRNAEDGRVNALQELETRKFELNDLQCRLENTEQRLVTLQQEYLSADKERDMLNDTLRRFYSAITRSTITMIPENAQMETAPIDIQTIDVHVQKLLSRVDKLEREKDDYRDSLSRLKRKTSDSHITINKHETLYKTIEERCADVEEERRVAETKLTSAKQLLRSQEEALKLRDEERRQLKSRLVANELESRSKEAQLRHLNELVKKLRAELETSQSEIRNLKDREEQIDTQKFQLESQIREHDGETQRCSMLMATFETERQNLNESMRKLTSQLQASETKNADLKEDMDKLRRELAVAERNETELRRSLDEQTNLAHQALTLKEQLSSAQLEAASSKSRREHLDIELSNVRSELHNCKQTLRDANNRISDLQRQLQDSLSDKNRLNDKISTLHKTISAQRTIETDLQHQLATQSTQHKSQQTEIVELKRQIERLELAKRTSSEHTDDLTKNRSILLKKIELLEKEKRNAETIINETAHQREAIERSLTALERENKELYRNCAQLQQQIAQLEMDNGNRLIALTNKQREEHDKFVHSVRLEKAQIERIVEHRDRTQKNRIKQLENQLTIMREQLHNERLRRRDATDRMLVSDMSKLGRSVFGFGGTTGIVSAGATYPIGAAQGIDPLISNHHSVYSSHYASPPSYSSSSYSLGNTSPIVDISTYRNAIATATTTTINSNNNYATTLAEPLETVQENYTSSYRMSRESTNDVDFINESNDNQRKSVESDVVTEATKNTTTIVVHMKGKSSSPESNESNVTNSE